MAIVVNVEFLDYEYIMPIKTEGGFKPFFTRDLDELKDKAMEVYGSGVVLNIEQIGDLL